MGIGAEGRKATQINTPPSVADAMAAVQQHASGPEADATGADGVSEHHEFTLRHADRRGRVWEGRFRCHVLTIAEKLQVGLIKARMSGGTPVDALDVYSSHLMEMLAHLAVALDASPDWAKPENLDKVRDTSVVQAIYEEVAQHEARFHGTIQGGPGQGDRSES